MNRSVEWGAVIATFLFVLSIVPRRCSRLTDFLHPELRKANAVLITPQLITLTLPKDHNAVEAFRAIGFALS